MVGGVLGDEGKANHMDSERNKEGEIERKIDGAGHALQGEKIPSTAGEDRKKEQGTPLSTTTGAGGYPDPGLDESSIFRRSSKTPKSPITPKGSTASVARIFVQKHTPAKEIISPLSSRDPKKRKPEKSPEIETYNSRVVQLIRKKIGELKRMVLDNKNTKIEIKKLSEQLSALAANLQDEDVGTDAPPPPSRGNAPQAKTGRSSEN